VNSQSPVDLSCSLLDANVEFRHGLVDLFMLGGVHFPRLLCLLTGHVCAYGLVSSGVFISLYLSCSSVVYQTGVGINWRSMAGFFTTEPSMYPPVGVYWLGESNNRAVMHFHVFARSSTRSVLVCRLGVMVMDVDFLPMAKPFSN